MCRKSVDTLGQNSNIFISVILNQPLPGEIPSLAFIQSFYIREWVRYLHSKLDDSTKIDNFGFDPEPDLSSEFKRNWIYGKLFQKYIQKYKLKYLEQDWTQLDMPQWNDGAGISSSIPDVMTPSWANLSRDHKLLICQAGQIGELHKGGLQLENSRRELAIGMAAIEIYQTLIDRQYEVSHQMLTQILIRNNQN